MLFFLFVDVFCLTHSLAMSSVKVEQNGHRFLMEFFTVPATCEHCKKSLMALQEGAVCQGTVLVSISGLPCSCAWHLSWWASLLFSLYLIWGSVYSFTHEHRSSLVEYFLAWFGSVVLVWYLCSCCSVQDHCTQKLHQENQRRVQAQRSRDWKGETRMRQFILLHRCMHLLNWRQQC